jgi:hypothetical protein
MTLLLVVFRAHVKTDAGLFERCYFDHTPAIGLKSL